MVVRFRVVFLRLTTLFPDACYNRGATPRFFLQGSLIWELKTSPIKKTDSEKIKLLQAVPDDEKSHDLGTQRESYKQEEKMAYSLFFFRRVWFKEVSSVRSHFRRKMLPLL